MAARSVLKLFFKTCPNSFNPAYSSIATTISHEGNRLIRQQRSYSQPGRPFNSSIKSATETIFQIRKISKSLQNLRALRHRDEDDIYEEDDRNRFPPPTNETFRDAAKEFKNPPPIEEVIDDNSVVYEIGETTRSAENVYEVTKHFRQKAQNEALRGFAHLQPQNIRPYGSHENLQFIPTHVQKRRKIVYPVTNTKSDWNRKKKVDDIHVKEFSSYRKQKEYPGYEEAKKIAVCEKPKQEDVNKKKFSTTSNRPKQATSKTSQGRRTLKLTLSGHPSFHRKSSTAVLRKNKVTKETLGNKIEDILQTKHLSTLDRFYKRVNEYKEMRKVSDYTLKNSGSIRDVFLTKSKSRIGEGNRAYNTYAIPPETDPKCDEFVTVKLSELQEECRRAKKCKPKKINFGRLPKLIPKDCPCYDDIPLKEGNPLARLKKRSEPKEKLIRDCEKNVCDIPRADANYKIVKKTLPVLELKTCPCEEVEMTDFVIKRLPKKKIPEPPKVCPPCILEPCCPERSDKDLKIKKKVLPKLKANNCPCIEDIPLKQVALRRLKPKQVAEPRRGICEQAICDTPRADANLKIVPKVLPMLKPSCVCVEPPPPLDVPPLQRLKKIVYEEKPRPSCDVNICEDAIRADGDLKFQQKRLPAFKPQACPCIEPRIPDIYVKLKRLKKRNNPVAKKEVCIVEECGARADDGMVIKPKKLPPLELRECPCVPITLEDTPPLPRLIPKPVVEPPRICDICIGDECCPPRADLDLKVEKKNLPKLPPGSCPCKEPEPLKDVPPLAKLKKRPVRERESVCIVEDPCPPRADENLKVKIKKLPKLEVPDCPCIEPPPPDDVPPLTRLKKVHVPEPPKICPKTDFCDEIPRSDEDDWTYWKRAECAESKDKSGRRNFSTSSKIDNDFIPLRYDIANLRTDQFKGSYNVIIDIKPSAPLILTQTPLEKKARDLFKDICLTKNGKIHRAEPVDCVSFVIYKSNSLGGAKVKSHSTGKECNEVNSLFSINNRFISTYSMLSQYAEKRGDKLKDHTTPSCECPVDNDYLQPKNPIFPERETFMKTFPSEELIENSIKKSQKYHRTRKDEIIDECGADDLPECLQEQAGKAASGMKDGEIADGECEKENEKKLTLWERIVNYFKARPDCPSPEEFRRMRLKEDAEIAARRAGLCVYDPKEMLKKNEKDLPKVITADDCPKEETSK